MEKEVSCTWKFTLSQIIVDNVSHGFFSMNRLIYTYSFPVALYRSGHPLGNFWDPLDRKVLKSAWKNVKQIFSSHTFPYILLQQGGKLANPTHV